MEWEDYQNYDATGLSELLTRGQVTAEDLAETAIQAIERLNPKINAVGYKMFDEAREISSRNSLRSLFAERSGGGCCWSPLQFFESLCQRVHSTV